MDERYSIGIDIGGTNVKLGIVALSDKTGRVRNSREMKTNSDQGKDQFIKRLLKEVRGLIDESKLKKSQFVGVGIGCPSWDGYNEVVGESHNMPEIKGLALGKIMEKEIGLPTCVDNDANAAADGERIFGGWGKAAQNIVIYTLGTGVGGGVVHTHPGTGVSTKITGHKLRGGELGHVSISLPSGKKSRKCTCGHTDCLEAHASATAVRDVAREKVKEFASQGKKSKIIDLVENDKDLRKLGIQPISDDEKIECIEAKHVALAADQDDELALEIEEETAFALAEGIRNAAQTFDPEIVVIAGKMGTGWKRLIEKAIKKFRKTNGVVPPEARIEISKLENAGILGAAALGIK